MPIKKRHWYNSTYKHSNDKTAADNKSIVLKFFKSFRTITNRDSTAFRT